MQQETERIRRYVDVQHVGTVLREHVESVDFQDDQVVSLGIHDTDVVMRGITVEELNDRNLDGVVDLSLCSIKYDGVKAKLHFHQDVVEEPFILDPAPKGAIDAQQTPRVEEFAPRLEPVIEAVESEFDVISWDFAKVNGGSIAHGGHITDFEFTFEIVSSEF